MWSIDLKILEQGDIYFFYKPKKGIKTVESIADVSRFYTVLAPEDKQIRFIVLGKKRMPKIDDGGKAGWGYIEKVGGRGFATQVLTPKSTSGASRPVGEGIYALIAHGDHTHLVYELELPKTLKRVQKAFEIRKKANYLISTKPQADTRIPTYPMMRYSRSKRPQYSPGRFISTSAEMLDAEGSELLLIPVKSDYKSLGITAQSSEETEATAEMFNRLKVNKHRHPTGPMLRGSWE